MPISQTTITGSVKTPANADAQITSVTFRLEGSDYEAGEIIAANSVSADVTTETGDFEVTLWPNDRGLKGTTKYTMSFSFNDGSSVPGLTSIYVRHSETPKTIEDVAFETDIGAIRNVAIILTTAAGFEIETKVPNALYLIRG